MKIIIVSLFAVLLAAAAPAATQADAQTQAQALAKSDNGTVLKVLGAYEVFAPVSASDLKAADVVLFKGMPQGERSRKSRPIVGTVDSVAPSLIKVVVDIKRGPLLIPAPQFISPGTIIGRFVQAFQFSP